jgi:hypothetical protein
MVWAGLAGVAAALAGCSADDSASAGVSQQLAEQNRKLDDQAKKIEQLGQQLEMLQQTLDHQTRPSVMVANADNALLTVDLDGAARKETIRQLAGFNGRLSAGLGYPLYAKSLGDLNSDLSQQLLEIKNQNFVEQAKVILKEYNLAGELWDKLTRADTEFVVLSPIDRYSYSLCGINFADGYRAKLSDLPRFWRSASDQTQKLIDMDKEFSQQEVAVKN